jgi:O-antigen/teichoic acid export membrane protein
MTRGAIVRNAGALVASQVVTKALNLAVSLALVRWLGAHELGRYAYVLAFCFTFGAVADFGLATLAIREISRDRAREAIVVAALRRLTAALAGVSVAAMLALAAVIERDPVVLTAIALAGVGSMISALTTPSLVLLTAREQLHWLGLHRMAASAVGSLLTLGVLLAGGRLISLLVASVATGVLMLGFARALAGPVTAPRALPSGTVRSMLRQAVPFGLLMIGYALYYRIDMVMLDWLTGARDVGLYAAAYRFLDTVVVLAASLGGPLFPRFSSLAAGAPDGARQLLEDVWRPLLALGLPLSLGATLLAGPLTRVLFGEEFVASAGLLRVLIWGTLPLFWVNVANHALIAFDRVWALVAVYGTSALVNVAANLVLIPRLGPLGASVATLVSEWLTLVLVVALLRATFSVSFSAAGLWRYALAAGGMCLAVWLVRGWGLPAEIAAGALVYGGTLLALGYMRSADHLAVKRLLAQ